MQKNSRRKVAGNKGWMGPHITPTCLSNSLKTFEFRGIQNFKAELNIIQYIIENSSKLEKIKLFIKKSKKPKSRSSLAEKFLLKGKKKSSVLVWVCMKHIYLFSFSIILYSI
jgi:hypothetical protein